MSTDEKLDTLIVAFSSFKESQEQSHKTLETKLQNFESKLTAAKESQGEATKRALKRIKQDRPLQFQRKGHEEQFHFNLDIQDHVSTAAGHLGKLTPSEKEKPIVEQALRELEEGASSLAEGKSIFTSLTSLRMAGTRWRNT